MKKITASILSVLMMLSMVFSSSVFAANEQPSAWESFVGLFSKQATAATTGVEYRGHIENIGNYPTDPTEWVQGPTQLGTVGKSLRLEGFWIQLTNKPANVNIQYRVHVQNVGWMAPVQNGNFAGTEGKSQRIEAIEIALVDDQGAKVTGYSVQYKGHIQYQGDTEWLADGAQLGTTGLNRRLEALEVKIVKTQADMVAYDAAVAKAEALTEADYTAESWAVLADALAIDVTADNTQAEVDAATTAITEAADALVFENQEDLDNAKLAVADLTEADYTAESWAAIGTALALPETTNAEVGAKALALGTAAADLIFAGQADLDAATAEAATKTEADYTVVTYAPLKAALELPETTNAEVVAKTAAITDAIAGLVEVADMDAYDAIVEKAEAVVEADYTAATYAALQTALEENVVTEQDTQADVDEATAAITAAYDALELVFKVQSVEALNAKQIKVVFSKAVDKTTAEATTGYALYEAYVSDTNKGAATATGNYTRTLLADNKTVIIYKNTGSWTQDSTIGLEIKDVQLKDVATTKVPTVFKTTHNLDTTRPVISSAEVLSSKGIKLQVSEPLNKNDATPVTQTNMITIDGVVAIAKVTTDNSTNEAIVDLSTGMAAGTHTLVLKNLKDYAGLSIEQTTFTIEVVKDTTPPSIQSATASDRGTITVNFNEPIVDIGTLTVAAGAGTTTFNTANKVTVANLAQNKWALSTDGKTATLKLATNNEMGLASIVEQEIKYSGTKDAEGNVVPATPQVASFKFAVADDTTLPTVGITVSNETATKNQVELNFSKTMSVVPTVTIKNASDVQVYSGTPSYDATSKKAVITAASFGASSIDAANYTIEVKNAKDNTVRQNQMATATQTLALNDTKAPSVVGSPVGTTGQKTIAVNFSEAMDNSTLSNKDNYLLAVGGNAATSFSNLAGSTVTVASDSKSVTLTWTATSTITGASTVTLLNLKDPAGNTITNFNSPLTVASAPAFTVANISGAKLTKVNEIKVTTDGTAFGTIDPANFVVYKSDGTQDDLFVGTAYTLNAAKTEATITLSGNLKTDVTYDGTNASRLSVVSGTTTNYAGSALVVAKGDNLSIADKVGPAVEVPSAGTFATTGDTITVPFSENISTSDANIQQALTVRIAEGTNAGTILLPGTDYTVTGTGTKTIAVKVIKAGINVKLTVALANNTLIADSSSNLASDFAAVTTSQAVAEATAPTYSVAYTKGGNAATVAKSGDTIVVTATFNEAMADSPVPQIALAGVAGSAVTATNMTKVDSTHYTYSWTVGTGDGTVTPTVSAGKDIAGNTVTDTGSTKTTFTVDNTSPTIAYTSSSSVTNLVATMNSDLYIGGVAVADGATIPVSNFTLSDATKNIVSATYNATAKTITFVFDAAVADNATITAKTTLTDAAGNSIASTVIGYLDASTDNKWEAIAD